MFYLEEIKPRIFIAIFDNAYDYAHVFLRVFEQGKNPEDLLLGRSLEWWKRAFVKEKNNIDEPLFDYPNEYDGCSMLGMNIRSAIQEGIEDWNEYDGIFLSIYGVCAANYPDHRFQLLGMYRNKEGVIDVCTFEHELAHAFYDLYGDYCQTMNKLTNKLPNEVRDHIYQLLSSWDYPVDGLDDELQAYLATGYTEYEEFNIMAQLVPLEKHSLPYKKAFKDHLEALYDFQRRVYLSR